MGESKRKWSEEQALAAHRLWSSGITNRAEIARRVGIKNRASVKIAIDFVDKHKLDMN